MRMRYRVLHEIDGGGMGVVYEGRRLFPEGQEMPVAIKMIRGNYSEDDMQLFAREAMTSLCINHEHPNLVTTHDFGVSDRGQPYLVMELVDGASVRQVAKVGQLPFPHVRRIALDMLRALGHLHKRGVMHRDVTPANILLSRQGAIKLADFGLVKPTDSSHSGRFCGTAAYASPEALQSGDMGAFSDLYSLGAVLYELLAGKRPHGSGDPRKVFARMVSGPAKPLPRDTPADLDELVSGMMAFQAQERTFAQANEAITFLEAKSQPVADDAEIAALVERACPRGKQHRKRRRRTRHGKGDTLVALRDGVQVEERRTGRVVHLIVAAVAFVVGMAMAGLIFWLGSAGDGPVRTMDAPNAPAGPLAAELPAACMPGEPVEPSEQIKTATAPEPSDDAARKDKEAGGTAQAKPAKLRERGKPRRRARAKPDQAPVSDKPLFYRVPPAEP